MVVLLIVAIIAAASAPMVTKKLSRSAGTNDSPWVFTGLNNSIAYNMSGNDNSTVIIGSTTVPNSMDGNTRLYIDSGNNASHIAFGNGNTEPLLLTADPAQGRIGFSNENIPASSVAFGTGQTISGNGEIGHIVAIGCGTQVTAQGAIALGSAASAISKDSIAIGNSAIARGDNSIAIGPPITDSSPFAPSTASNYAISIGNGAQASSNCAIAIGSWGQKANYDGLGELLSVTTASGERAIAVGTDAKASKENSIAIGKGAEASGLGSTAIGDGAEASGLSSTAIGDGAVAKAWNSTAIGDGAVAQDWNSTAIGTGAQTTTKNEIVLGTPEDTVYIPGNVIIDGDIFIKGTIWKKFSDGFCLGFGSYRNVSEQYWKDYALTTGQQGARSEENILTSL